MKNVAVLVRLVVLALFGSVLIVAGPAAHADEVPVGESEGADPAGIVTDQYGRPRVGATVTLQHLQGGVFVDVPDGSDIMTVGNRSNPDTTDEDGHFQWGVAEGTYRVLAQVTGCNPGQTGPMAIPPARSHLVLKLTCSVAAPAPLTQPRITGTFAVGQTIAAASADWAAPITENPVQLLRNGAVVASPYMLTNNDTGATFQALSTGQRPSLSSDDGPDAANLNRTVAFTGVEARSVAQTFNGLGKITASQPVAINGIPEIGKRLWATPPTWTTDNATPPGATLPGVSTTYQWTRDGVSIPGATGENYTVTGADLGRLIRIVATGTRTGYTPGTSTSTAVTGEVGDAPRATTPPVVSGTGVVGTTLRTTAPVWDISGVTTSFQWTRDGAAIPGATRATYDVVTADVGKQIRVVATGAKEGHPDGTSTSQPVTAHAASAPAATVNPEIIGEAEVGERVTATTGTWNTTGLTFTYQWLLDGVAIPGADDPTYLIDAADAGGRLSVEVTATRPGYDPGTARSDAVTIGRVAAIVGLRAPRRLTEARADLTNAMITIRTAGDVDPTGRIVLRANGRRIGVAQVNAIGRAGINLRKLDRKGLYRLVAVYRGSDEVAPARSRIRFIRIR